MLKKLRLSIVDAAPVIIGHTRHNSYLNSIDLAKHVEALGYERFWIAEHHYGHLVGRAPEAMVPLIASNTKHIRVGSGGVLINYYSPFKVAENFQSISEMFPGRIDMGVGRANTNPVVDFALQKSRDSIEADTTAEDPILELRSWFNNDFPAKHPFSAAPLAADPDTAPEFWLLGSSHYRATTAGQLGLPFCYAGFINQGSTPEAVSAYRKSFIPCNGGKVKKPEIMIAVHVVCADTEEEARALLAPILILYRRMAEGLQPSFILPKSEDAVRELGGLPEVNLNTPKGVPPRFIVGNPQQVKDTLFRLAEELDVDSFVIQDLIADHNGRKRSLELIAKLAGVEPRHN